MDAQIMKLRGRSRIFTDEREITSENIIKVLANAYVKHLKNQREIDYLLDFKGGEQPLLRDKTVRPEIDIKDVLNAAEYITWFHKAYFWSQPPMLVQRSNEEIEESNADTDDSGINALNEMLYNGEYLRKKEIELSEYVETAGIGYMMVDYKTEFPLGEDEPSFVSVCNLDPRYTFCVYLNAPGQKKMLGVSYVESTSKKKKFTCYTEDKVFEVVGLGEQNGKNITVYQNVLRMIPIVEYTRSVDRYGVFEHHMDALSALNTVSSDFDNDMAQSVQEIKWANDIDFPTDPDTGEAVKPVSGEWLLTHSGADKNPKIESVGSQLDRSSALSTIQFKWNNVLQLCRVPVQYDSAGGGSTGTATSMASGWSTTELDAKLKEGIVEASHRELVTLVIRALQLVPLSVLPKESPLRNVRVTDIVFHFVREHSYDMTVKMNAFATGIKCGINGRHLLKWIDAFNDVETVWIDSKDMIEAYQQAQVASNAASETSEDGDDRIASDNSDQVETSPFIDGMTRSSGRGT